MIRVNLLGDDTIVDATGLWILIGYALSLGTLILFLILLQASTLSNISSLEPEKASLEKRLADMKETTKEVRELDKKRKELQEKTDIIALLKRNKRGPVRVLDDLNNALPEKAWLTEAKEENGKLKITGLALENQTIADFMTALEASAFFSKVELLETKQIEQGPVKLKNFMMEATIHYGGETTALAKASPSPEVAVVADAAKGAVKE